LQNLGGLDEYIIHLLSTASNELKKRWKYEKFVRISGFIQSFFEKCSLRLYAIELHIQCRFSYWVTAKSISVAVIITNHSYNL